MATSENYRWSILNASDEYQTCSVLDGSDEVKECEPCQKAGNTIDATKYCTDCSEYLCGKCSTSHTMFKSFQFHVLKDVNRAHCEPCQKVGKRTINAVKYCTNCLENMCNECSTLHVTFKAFHHHVIQDMEAVSITATGRSSKPIIKPANKIAEIHIDHDEEQQRSANAKSTPNVIRKVTARLVTTIDIRTSKDVTKPNIGISGLTVVQTSYCVVRDINNKSIKVVDTRNARIISEVALTKVDYIWALTSINDKQVAVTARIKGDVKLVFLYVSSSGIISKSHHSIGVKLPSLYHILHFNDRYYTSEGLSNDIKVINTRGKTITTITNESFCNVTGIAVSNDHNTIYVCSCGNDKVFGLDLNGNVKATYTDKNLKGPCCVTVDGEGYVYVCSVLTRDVHQLSADISTGHVIISDVYANSCAFNKVENRLYLGKDSEIKVYDMKWS